MSEMTPEKTHQLLEKLAEYVMNEVPRKSEVASKEELGVVRQELGSVKQGLGSMKQELGSVKQDLGSVKQDLGSVKQDLGSVKQDLGSVRQELGSVRQELKTDINELREDVQNIKGSLNIVLNGMDKQAQQLEIIRTEQASFNHAINRIEERVEKLEQVH